ncbi:Hsp70 family protein [Methanospirillum hungatei]|jgi:molecular chaperone DnaK|uniref:Hsp70 family protein n=1 Tax=Methanospirillum hungatei TaxID=2203 RepID=UPI001B66C9F1|nr:Hsp70 family protein [Methanospirillum hungatei]MBP9007882.1 Hsp70 family protein [Methanospirillum sp.]HOW05374.1 Hsp70 family protein [Methanospirillum hungatei]
MNKDIIGIDFGTTNSKMAYMLLDEPVVIENDQGSKITPSVVYFKNEKEFSIGEQAKHNQIIHPDKVVSSIKREMGTDYKKQVGRFKFPPEYIGALIFQKLIQDARERTGKTFYDAVVSVPANYSDSQRQAIMDAAEIAGINVVRLINEPTAAALAYGIREDRDRKVLVYDFGGGTFDVSILSVSSGFFDVDASTGEHRLGGDDLDTRIIAYITKALQKELGKGDKIDLALQATLKEAAEEAKIALSTEEITRITIPFVAENCPPFTMELTRQTLESLIQDLIERTRAPMERALHDASLEKDEIDDILLVGGTTLIPAVRRFVTEYFGKEPLEGDPYTAVAEGAALAGSTYVPEKSRMAKNVEISDVISSSLGVKITNGTLSRVIERNTKIPISRTRLYTNSWDYVPEVIIAVYQGEEEMAEDNEYLGQFYISVEPMPAEENKIEVTFAVGEEFGILNVRAYDTDSGNERTVKFESRSRLSKKEKSKWMKKLVGKGSVHVVIGDESGKTTLDMYLNPATSIESLKRELIDRQIMTGDEMIEIGEMTPGDDLRISDLNLEDGCIITIRGNNGE